MSRHIWIAEKDYSGHVIQLYHVCKECARSLLNKPPKPAHPTYFTRIPFRKADKILKAHMGYGAHGGVCDMCEE